MLTLHRHRHRMAEAEAMPNLNSAEADDPPRLEKVAEEEKQDAR